MKKNILLIVFILTIFGGFLRFYNLENNPPSLSIDEVAYGYSAYSILKTARDETGEFMPLTFRSTGDYKNPVFVYSLVPTIALFGLNEFGVRFNAALVGTLSIPLFFLFVKRLTQDTRIALIGTIFLTLSSWHIYYSRVATDHLLGTLLVMLGIFFYLKNNNLSTIISAVILAVSMYTYHSQRIFVPLFIFALLLITKRFKLPSTKLFLAIFFILALPLILLSIFGPASTRVKMVFLTQDIDYTRYVILDHFEKFGEIFLLFFFWIKRYLNYFQPEFLFFNGLNMTNIGTLGLGILHLFELPFLVLGTFELIKRKFNYKLILFLWILIGLIPASITNNEQSSGRSLLILPAVIIVLSIGAIRAWEIIRKFSNKYFIPLVSIYSLSVIIFLIHSFMVFHVYLPTQRGEAFMEGTKQTVLYALANKDQYSEIVFDPYRGIEAPYIVNVPHMYILFYAKYDPLTYQNEITIRKINWRVDRAKKGTLFVGSPWSLPLQDIKEGEILQKVYLLNGDLALLTVSPRD